MTLRAFLSAMTWIEWACIAGSVYLFGASIWVWVAFPPSKTQRSSHPGEPDEKGEG